MKFFGSLAKVDSGVAIMRLTATIMIFCLIIFLMIVNMISTHSLLISQNLAQTTRDALCF